MYLVKYKSQYLVKTRRRRNNTSSKISSILSPLKKHAKVYKTRGNIPPAIKFIANKYNVKEENFKIIEIEIVKD